MLSEQLEQTCSVLVAQMSRYYLPNHVARTLSTTARVLDTNLEVSYVDEALGLAGSIKGNAFDILDGLRLPLTQVVEAVHGTRSPWPLSLNFSTWIESPCQRPVGNHLLLYDVFPSCCEQLVRLARALEAEERADDAHDAWLLARHFWQCSGAATLSRGKLGDLKRNRHVQAYLAEHNPAVLHKDLFAGFWQFFGTHKTRGKPAAGTKRKHDAFFTQPSSAFADFSSHLNTRSVLKAAEAYLAFYREREEDPLALLELAGSLEWLIWHDTSEPKNMERQLPVLSELIRSGLEHPCGPVRKRYRVVAGFWLNFHLLILDGQEDLTEEVFRAIVFDAAQLRLGAVGGGLKDTPGLAERLSENLELQKDLRAFEAFTIKHREWALFPRRPIEHHFGPELPLER